MFGKFQVEIPDYSKAPVHSSNSLRWILFFLSPHKWLFAGLTINRTSRMVFFWGIEPLLVAKMIESFENGSAFNNPSIVWNYIWIFIGLSITFYILLIICAEESKLHERIARSARMLGLSHLNKLSASWHEQAESGGKLQKIMTGSAGLQQIFRLYFFELLEIISSFLGTVIALWFMDIPAYYIALFAGMSLSYITFAWWSSFRIARGYDEVNILLEKLSGKVYEFINSTMTLKTFNLGSFVMSRAKNGEQEGYDRAAKVYCFDYLRWIVLNLIGLMWMMLIIYFAINQTLSKDISIAAFALIAYQMLAIWASLESFTSIYSRLIEENSAFKRLIELLRQPITINDAKNSKVLKVEQGEISFKKVDFKYKDSKQVFSNLTLHIKSGEKIGILGRSGSGKSTLVKLLLRFYDPNKNSITIDGINIKKVTQESLRQNIAVIPQDVALFNHTIRDNIRYGRLDATDEEVLTAAKQAQADEFIKSLPKGYDTIVGERGVKLSGGQRQRIAIARAILKNAPILVLDEATSALDTQSEQLIQQSLNELMHNKTVIAIAHRLSTIKHLDRLVVMENGKIVEQGTHDELINQNGHYAKLWKMQSGGFIGE